MNLDSNAIRLLRQSTSAGMLDCRRALAESGGDPAAAEVLLKTWGLASVEKRSERVTNEGRVFIAVNETAAAMAEIDCETDFVARNGEFLKIGARIVEAALRKSLEAPDSETEELIAGLAAIMKENIVLKRLALLLRPAGGYVTSYLHGDGRIGVLVTGSSRDPAAFEEARVKDFFHDLALHIAAFGPRFLDESQIPSSYIEEKLGNFREQVAEDERLRGKPAKMLEAIVEGKLKKHLAEVCLLSHGFVKDEKTPVAEVLEALRRESGLDFSLATFSSFQIGN
jgi:elongation factor Ts